MTVSHFSFSCSVWLHQGICCGLRVCGVRLGYAQIMLLCFMASLSSPIISFFLSFSLWPSLSCSMPYSSFLTPSLTCPSLPLSLPLWPLPASSPLYLFLPPSISLSLPLRRVMGMRTCDSRCLFSGSKGEVCCVEPLHAGPELKDHPITQYSLLAMASLTKVPSGLPLPHNHQQTLLFSQLGGLQCCCVLRESACIPMLSESSIEDLTGMNQLISLSLTLTNQHLFTYLYSWISHRSISHLCVWLNPNILPSPCTLMYLIRINSLHD